MSRPSSSPSSSKTRLGDLLWRRGACDRNAIRRALALQARDGDRLGTNLLASGWISEKDLALALGEQLSVHAAYGDLIDVKVEALALVDVDLAAKYLVLPHHIEDETLFVLMVEPHDERALDALRETTQREISPVVVCEARMWELLQLHYDVRSSTRAIVPLDDAGLTTSTSSLHEEPPSSIHQIDADPIESMLLPPVTTSVQDTDATHPVRSPMSDAQSAKTPQSRYNQLFQDFPEELKSDGPAGNNAASPLRDPTQGVSLQNEVVSIRGRTRQSTEQVTLENAIPTAPSPAQNHTDSLAQNDVRRGAPSRKMHAMVKKFQSHEDTERAAAPPEQAISQSQTPRESNDELKALYQKLLHPDPQSPNAHTDSMTSRPTPSSPPGHTDEKPTGQSPLQSTSPVLQGNYRKELGRRLQENIQKAAGAGAVNPRTATGSAQTDASMFVAAVPSLTPLSNSAGSAENNPSHLTASAAKSTTALNDAAPQEASAAPPVHHADFAQKIFQQTPTRFRRLALLSVHADQITGWDADGDLPLQRVRNFCVARDTSSVFQWVAESQTPYVGPLQATPANELWVDASGGQRPKSVVVLPISVDGVVAHLLYGDNGQEQHVSSDIGELSSLAQRISDAYALMVELAQKTSDK